MDVQPPWTPTSILVVERLLDFWGSWSRTVAMAEPQGENLVGLSCCRVSRLRLFLLIPTVPWGKGEGETKQLEGQEGGNLALWPHSEALRVWPKAVLPSALSPSFQLSPAFLCAVQKQLQRLCSQGLSNRMKGRVFAVREANPNLILSILYCL